MPQYLTKRLLFGRVNYSFASFLKKEWQACTFKIKLIKQPNNEERKGYEKKLALKIKKISKIHFGYAGF
jgi:hypothetical protein